MKILLIEYRTGEEKPSAVAEGGKALRRTRRRPTPPTMANKRRSRPKATPTASAMVSFLLEVRIDMI